MRRRTLGDAERPEPTPGKVTETRLQVRDSNRMSIYVDGSFSFGMPLDAAMQLHIRKGVELDRVLLDRCLEADALYRARQRALGLLSHRPRTTAELRDRLTRAGFSPPVVASALERMRTLGYLDDQAFAEEFARFRLLTRRQGARRVVADLRKKGIDAQAAERIVNTLSEDRDEYTDALDLARTRLSQMARLDPEKIRRRLYAYLARRGFGSSTIQQAIRTATSELAAGGPTPD